ncbi:MAG: hypothetical protein ACRDMJ_19775 [Solirubrobacteraceae bacterium]
MGRGFFDRLEAELTQLTYQGAHLTAADRAQHRIGRLVRRGLVLALVVVALAAALVSEFPASASGHAQLVAAVAAQRL